MLIGDLPLVLLEHILLSLSAAELARVVTAGRCFRDALPGVVQFQATQLGVLLPGTRASLTRWLKRITGEVVRVHALLLELRELAVLHEGRTMHEDELRRMHVTVIDAQMPALLQLVSSAPGEGGATRAGQIVVLSLLGKRARPQQLTAFVAACVRWIMAESTLYYSIHNYVDTGAAQASVAILLKVPAEAIVPFAPALAALLDQAEVDAPAKAGRSLFTESIMVMLSKLPPSALVPHAASLPRWLSRPPQVWEGQAAILRPCLTALMKLPPEMLVEHLPALERPRWPPSKLLINKVRRAAGRPRVSWD